LSGLFVLLSAQAVQIPPQLRGSGRGFVGETTRPIPCPESTIAGIAALNIALIHPAPLRLAEALLELGTAGLTALRDELLVRLIEIGIVYDDRAIEAGALIDWSG
jgi:hypothetical protein